MSYRLIDHEPEGRTDKVSAMRGHSVAEARLPLLAQNRRQSSGLTLLLSGVKRTPDWRRFPRLFRLVLFPANSPPRLLFIEKRL